MVAPCMETLRKGWTESGASKRLEKEKTIQFKQTQDKMFSI